jgi:hypothetical protein
MARVMGLSWVSAMLKSAGARQWCDWVGVGENWSRHWADMKRDEMKKKKVDQLWGIGPKELREYIKGFLIFRI